MNNNGPNETQMTGTEQPSSANLDMHADDEKAPAQMVAGQPVATGSKRGGRCCCITSVLVFLLVVGAAAAVVFLVVLRPPGERKMVSPDYDVQWDMEEKQLVLSPKEGNTHEYTLIWLHGLNQNHKAEFWKYFAEQGNENRLTSNNTKIIIPQADKMELSRPPPPKPKEGDDEDEEGPPGGRQGGPDGKRGPPPNGGKDGPPRGQGGDRRGEGQGPRGNRDGDDKKEYYAWFDMLKGDKDPGEEKTEADWQSRYDQDGIIASSDRIIKIVKNETENLGGDASKVIVGGFSQGGVLSLAVYLRYDVTDKPLGGVFSLSGMQGLDKSKYPKNGTGKKDRDITQMRGKTPLFTYYGKDDKGFKGSEVTYKMFKDKVYKSSKYKANWSRNDVEGMGHKITKEELVKLSEWLAPLQNMSQ